MADIDIGPGADTISGGFFSADYTNIDETNPANQNGIITTFYVYAHATLGGFKAGTWHGSGTDYTCRDFETIGTVTSGSKQTFSGLTIDVKAGDVIGYYHSSGENPVRTVGSGGLLRQKNGDNTANGEQTYTSVYATLTACVYGEGDLVSGWTGTILGVASPASVMGVAAADIANVMGV